MVYEEIFLAVGIVSVLIAVSVPFVTRGLNKGEKQIITTNNYYNLANNVTSLEKRVEKGFEEAKEQRQQIIELHRRDMRSIYESIAQMTGDIKLHTNQIATFCLDCTKLEDRLRSAEREIIRNERSRIKDKDNENENENK